MLKFVKRQGLVNYVSLYVSNISKCFFFRSLSFAGGTFIFSPMDTTFTPQIKEWKSSMLPNHMIGTWSLVKPTIMIQASMNVR